MGLNWKELPRDGIRGSWAALYVTLNRKGHISLSGVTWQRLSEPEAVHILFDESNQRIGLKPTSRALRNSYPLMKINGQKGYRIHAYRLLQEYNILIDQTIQFFDAEIDVDGILILNLRTARVPARVRNHRDNKPKTETESVD